MTPLRVLDLFSGIGGFSLGLERTGGFKTVAFCEIEPFPRRVLAKHWPEVPCYDDVRELTLERLVDDGVGRPSVICGGFPCQDLSASGRRAGLEGERSGLWAEYARLVREICPSFVIVENVPGLLVHGMGRVLGDLADAGLDAEWIGIPAAALGAPHYRARQWLVAYPVGYRGRAPESALCAGWGFPRLRAEWASEPRLDRVADGLPNRVDRHHALGNAVVPAIPELIGNAILTSLANQEAA